jgi:hypothetical protein
MRKIFIRIGQIFKRSFVDVEANESARKPWLSDEEEPGEDGIAEKKMERLPLAKPLLVLRNDCSEFFGQRQAYRGFMTI